MRNQISSLIRDSILNLSEKHYESQRPDVVYLGLIGFWSFFILLLFTKEQGISGSFSVALYRHRDDEAPTGLGPIKRTVLGDWSVVRTADVTKELSVIRRRQFLSQLQIKLVTSTHSIG